METEFLKSSQFEMVEKNKDKKKIHPKQYSPLVLAYIGDAIYEVFSRTKVVTHKVGSVHKLHNQCKEYVKAEAQATIVRELEAYLTEEEKNIVRRGRNAKSHTTPKNADLIDYKMATGLEALVGYLYLAGEIDRLEELIQIGFDRLEQQRHSKC
ncbi:MAG: Mini-ribonuclease 3 [Epulopiscium sp.]|nr:Mini-ribonuclease 3 [Candidatus Epulonipiscium sp.]